LNAADSIDALIHVHSYIIAWGGEYGLTEPYKNRRTRYNSRPLARDADVALQTTISKSATQLWYALGMTTKDIKSLLERIQAWPEEAQDELVNVANQIESELKNREYLATQEELRIIDAAAASIDRGEFATDVEVERVFAKFRPA
jgi:hypothetical protein